MKKILVVTVTFLVLLQPSYTVNAEEPKLERIEWSDVWVVNANQDEGRRVLLVGDSIVKGYYGVVENALSGKASCARYATSLFLSNPDYLTELRVLLKRYQFDVIHINNGLHGWDYSEDEYEAGLWHLLAVLKETAPEAKVIWCMSTPMRVAENLSEINTEMNNRVIERNRIAAEIMEQHEVSVNDLYAAVIDHPDYFSKDGVHFNGKGQKVEGKQVAAMIEKYLP